MVFQFTPLREGRQANCLDYAPDVIFQFTPLREGRPGKLRQLTTRMTYFNSRPSARGDQRLWKEYTTWRFQFTPLREGRRFRCSTSAATPYFNSRPSARGDPHPHPIIHRRSLFQFTPLREGRPCPVDRRGQIYNFNSRPSARGDATVIGGITALLAFQFTPLREGRPSQSTMHRIMSMISIHAPPRGATCRDCEGMRGVRISIHAPPRGATYITYGRTWDD